MNADRWREVSRIYGAVLTKPELDRATALASLCRDDAELRAEVESLLQSGTDAALIDRAATERPSTLGLIDGRAIGMQIGVFRIDSLLGVGGMGEVYRARDTKLNRDVAIKILPPAFASDPERLARFKREAQVLASLNHPNIGAIHGFEDSDGIHALVLELVDGPTLADTLAHGSGLKGLPIEEALSIARQICDALEAAHERGIIHRDLKPANIKVREDGTVKVLDFGLAKIAETSSQSSASVTQSPTITTPAMTAAGMILGTAAYMSPEQAKGKPADKRSDIWAFGCVLYEMLTGERPFKGDDVADTLAVVLRADPNWSALPSAVPPHLTSLVRRCMSRDRAARIRDVGDVRFELNRTEEPSQSFALDSSRARARERMVWIVATLALAVAFSWLLLRPHEGIASAEPRMLEIVTPATSDPVSIAVAPDGRQLAAVVTVNGRSQLWLRSLVTGQSRLLPRTERAQFPFWSPDSRTLGFNAEGAIKRVDLDGDTLRVVVSAALPAGASWNRAGDLIYAPTGLSAIWRLPADGGAASPVTTIKRPLETAHSFPVFLPDGRHFLFFVNGRPEVRGVHIGDLAGGAEPHRLIEADAAATYSPSGAILFVRDRTLLSQAFNLTTLQLTDRPVQVAPQVAVLGGVANVPAMSAAANALVYRTGDAGRRRQLVWVDRSGSVIRMVGTPDPLFPANPSLAPDDRSLLVSRLSEGNADIWKLDADRGTADRMTAGAAAETYPLWEKNGKRFVFTATGPNPRAGRLHIRDASGAESTDRDLGIDGIATDWSPDGSTLLVRQVGDGTGMDLVALLLSPEPRILPIASSKFDEREGQFSPDGKWVLFQSDESGQPEIWLQSFPDARHRLRVSLAGGEEPRWNNNGKEVFYLQPDRRMTVAAITLPADGMPVVGKIDTLFERRDLVRPGASFRQQFTVSRDGRRFLLSSLADEPTSTPVTVILNWRPANAPVATP